MPQGVLPLSDKLKTRLNNLGATARDTKLGKRLAEHEFFGTLSYSYNNAHADKTYLSADLPATSIVSVTLTSANAAANLILPTDNKVYIVRNNSGQTITIKVAGQTGVAVATAKTAILMSNGTDIVRVTADT